MQNFLRKSTLALLLVASAGVQSARAQVQTPAAAPTQTPTPITIQTPEEQKEAQRIDQVVVTALGISRRDRTLGYAQTTVDGGVLSQTASGNWVDALSGRVPGLKLDQAGTGPMGSARITVRGDNSLNYGNNQVLVVVDGVPVNSGGEQTSGGNTYSNNDAPVDFGNGLSDLNPDDIESVSVLKGAAAAALYGSRAGNGVLMITTKRASKKKGLGIALSSTTTIERVMRWPDFQTEYGGGGDMGEKPYSFWGPTRNQSRYAFGERYDGLPRIQYNGMNWQTGELTATPWEYKDNWFKGFFETGVTTRNSITLSGSDGKQGSMRLAVTDVRSRWVMPNTPNASQTFSLNASKQLNRAIRISAVVNYLRRDSENVPYSGYGMKNPIYSLIWSTSNHDIRDGFRAEYFSGRFTDPKVRADNALFYNAENSYNPYFTVYEETNTLDRDRMYGNFKADVDFGAGLSMELRSGVDLNNEFRTQRAPIYSGSNPGGFYREQTIRHLEYEHTALLKYKRKFFGEKLGVDLAAGTINFRRETANVRLTVPRLGEDNVFNISNIKENYVLETTARRTAHETSSVVGYANLNWREMVYLDITARNDWDSSLDRRYWSIFYPSASLSFLLDEALGLQYSGVVDMLKLRASWAQVGVGTSPYALSDMASATNYPGGYTAPGTIATRNLTPERVTSVDVGTDLSMFKGRVTLNASYYHSSTRRQIISVPIDPMTGAQSVRKNGGEIQNRGVELAASFAPIRNTRGFSWNFAVNWSRNWDKLVSMYDGWDPASPLQTPMGTTIGNRTYVYSFVGESMHWIYGKDYLRAPAGSTYVDASGNTVDCSGAKIIDPKTGMPALTPNPDQRIAKVTPDWLAGMSHTFSYRNLSLNMNFAAQWGGHTFSATHFALAYQGKLNNSLEGRYDGMVVDGVNAVKGNDGTISYKKNQSVTASILKYYNSVVYTRDNTRENTFDNSYLKLKTLRLDYKLSTRALTRTGFLRGASIGVFATNVFCITKYPMFDPETGTMQGTNIFRGVETGAMPMTRTFGVDVKLNF